MKTQTLHDPTDGLGARLAIGELTALIKVIESTSDGEVVRRWSLATITNVLYSLQPTEQITVLVRQAKDAALNLAAELAPRPNDGDQTTIRSLRIAIIQMLRTLIGAISNQARPYPSGRS